MDEIVKEFLIESNENLDRLDQELVKLESEPSSKELLASVFRTIHTIKGSCGFLGFARLEKVAHAGESLLSLLRDAKVALTEEVTSGLLAMVDAVRHMLAAIQDTERDGEDDYPELLEELTRLTSGPQAASFSHIKAQHRPTLEKMGGLLVERGNVRPEDLALALQEQERGDPRRVGDILVALELCKQEEVLAAQQIIESRNREAGTDTIRVGVNLLDKLMNLVGELVLARNQLLQFSNATQDAGFHAVSQHMNLIATELQEQVMKTRMQPIGNVWNKFPRTVRDLALSCSKEVRLEMEGQETELDRTIIEAIKDPLTHLVRNAVDHGIELPKERKKKGKESCGRLLLRAFHEGGQVNIEISDDGAGLNPARIREKAIERGLVGAAQAERMPERELFNLIFLPGFSTAEKVSNVSGRGVGMDVVRTNVEKVGGAVEVQSSLGRGTTVRVKIPLTLAIVPALIVSSGGNRFALPQVSLLELVRLEPGETSTRIETVHGAPVYRLRGRLLPLAYLDRELQITQAAGPDAAINIVVLQAEDRQFGLVVDEIIDTQEIVVKPLGKQLKGIPAYSGATIMGDGRVALILDVVGLARQAKVIAEVRESTRESPGESTRKEMRHGDLSSERVEESHALLLAENGPEGRVAIPLSLVARLEEFPASVMEYAGTQEVMQYRGQIIPLLRLSQIVPAGGAARAQAAESSIHVVVYSEGRRTVGLIVDRIVDIIDEHAAVETLAARAGVVGSFVAQSHVTDLLNVPAIVRTALPNMFEAAGPKSAAL
jgi:two-component system chemotaxis sensor kinase CheA